MGLLNIPIPYDEASEDILINSATADPTLLLPTVLLLQVLSAQSRTRNNVDLVLLLQPWLWLKPVSKRRLESLETTLSSICWIVVITIKVSTMDAKELLLMDMLNFWLIRNQIWPVKRTILTRTQLEHVQQPTKLSSKEHQSLEATGQNRDPKPHCKNWFMKTEL